MMQRPRVGLWAWLLVAVVLAAASAALAPRANEPAGAASAHADGAAKHGAKDKDDDDRDDDDAKPPAAPAVARPAQAKKDDDDDDDDKKGQAAGGKLALSPAQQEAVGIRTGTPLPLSSAPEVQAFGLVLDPVALFTDAGRLESTRAAAGAASADTTRLESLYRDGAQASLKSLQASQAQSIEANAQAQAAALAFHQQWGPLATLRPEERRALMGSLENGRRLLLRAEVPGRHVGGGFGERALVDVDGVHLSARVLGPLPRTDAASQGAGWLLETDSAPEGLGPGARVPVRLMTAHAEGLLVPAGALIYAEQGAYVYRQKPAATGAGFEYESVAVKPLTRVGDSWLVGGLTRNDQIVVQGAGVLWSLQGIGSFSADEEDHD